MFFQGWPGFFAWVLLYRLLQTLSFKGSWRELWQDSCFYYDFRSHKFRSTVLKLCAVRLVLTLLSRAASFAIYIQAPRAGLNPSVGGSFTAV